MLVKDEKNDFNEIFYKVNFLYARKVIIIFWSWQKWVTKFLVSAMNLLPMFFNVFDNYFSILIYVYVIISFFCDNCYAF